MSSFKDAVKAGMTEYLDELKQKLEGLTEAEVQWQATLDTNTIAWLVWHMAKVEDSWINVWIAGGEEVWVTGKWAERTGIAGTSGGFGQVMDEVRSMPNVPISELVAYYEAVRKAAFETIDGMTDADMANEIDRGHGPITWSWILGHVMVEESQHLGQVALIRGMIRGLDG
jgi:uncharacterized damage-inducible protein DinB